MAKKIEQNFFLVEWCGNMANTTMTIAEGDFKSLKISDWEREMLDDAYKAVTKANKWGFLRRPDVPGPKGFMFSDWPEMKDIDIFMEYGGHSGSSYGMTMRAMEFIAKNGWDAYAQNIQDQQRKKEEEERKRKEPASTKMNNLFQTAAVVDQVIHKAAQKGEMDPLAFTQMLQANPQIRAVIPDIDEQASAMKRFAEGKLSYAEMRSLCG
jgi:hypothetical protein